MIINKTHVIRDDTTTDEKRMKTKEKEKKKARENVPRVKMIMLTNCI